MTGEPVHLSTESTQGCWWERQADGTQAEQSSSKLAAGSWQLGCGCVRRTWLPVKVLLSTVMATGSATDDCSHTAPPAPTALLLLNVLLLMTSAASEEGRSSVFAAKWIAPPWVHASFCAAAG